MADDPGDPDEESTKSLEPPEGSLSNLELDLHLITSGWILGTPPTYASGTTTAYELNSNQGLRKSATSTVQSAAQKDAKSWKELSEVWNLSSDTVAPSLHPSLTGPGPVAGSPPPSVAASLTLTASQSASQQGLKLEAAANRTQVLGLYDATSSEPNKLAVASQCDHANLAEKLPPLEKFPPNTHVTIKREDILDGDIDADYMLPFKSSDVSETPGMTDQPGGTNELLLQFDQLEDDDSEKGYADNGKDDGSGSIVDDLLYAMVSGTSLKTSDGHVDRSQVATYISNLFTGNLNSERLKSSPSGAKLHLLLARYHTSLQSLLFFLRQASYQELVSTPLLRAQVENIKTNYGAPVGAFFATVRQTFLLQVFTALLWTSMILLPCTAALKYERTFHLRDILTVSGAISRSWFFYGAYTEHMPPTGYPMNVIYMLCVYVTYFCGMIYIMKLYARAGIEERSDTSAESKFEFCSLVFGSWDHAFSADLGRATQTKNFCVALHSLIHDRENVSKSDKEVLESRIRMAVAWFLALGITAISGTAIFFSFGTDMVSYYHERGYNVEPDNFIITVGPAMLFTLLNGIFSEIVYWLPLMENYERSRDVTYVNIMRVYIMRTSNVITLVVALRRRISLGYFVGCSGTLLAAELYKIIIIDTLVGVISTVVPCFLKIVIKDDKIEFGIASHVLRITHRLTLIWLCSLVCPAMPLISVFSILIFFYTCYFSVLRFSKPPSSLWREDQRSTLFTGIMRLNMFLVIILVSFITSTQSLFKIGEVRSRVNSNSLLGEILPDKFCGPVNTLNGTSINEAWLDVMQHGDSNFRLMLQFITSYSFAIPLVFTMFAVLYYQSLQLQVEQIAYDRLEQEMIMERDQHQAMIKSKMYDKQGNLLVSADQLKVSVPILLNVRTDDDMERAMGSIEKFSLKRKRGQTFAII